ncbi:MAG: hypothetical protein JHC26_11655 [Thermofilum sp.]|nr:hypothetical protein [Thermofilum sp.]
MRGIALLGKEASDKQVRVISGLVKGDIKVRVLLDRDAWQDGVMVGMKLCNVLSYNNVEVGFLVGLKDPGEGRDRRHVLENAVFLGLGDGIGRVVEVMKSLMLERLGKGLKRLRGECDALRVHM